MKRTKLGTFSISAGVGFALGIAIQSVRKHILQKKITKTEEEKRKLLEEETSLQEFLDECNKRIEEAIERDPEFGQICDLVDSACEIAFSKCYSQGES